MAVAVGVGPTGEFSRLSGGAPQEPVNLTASSFLVLPVVSRSVLVSPKAAQPDETTRRAAVNRISVGVVGLGTIAQAQHLPNLVLLDDLFRVAAVADLSASLTTAIADRLPGRVFTSTDWREICGHPEVEAVLLLTPGAHQRMSQEALSAGKHVFSEKPLSLTVAGAKHLASLADDAERVLQIGYMKLHEQVFPHLMAGLEMIGRHRLIRHTVYHPSHQSQFAHVDLLRFNDADQSVLEAEEVYELARTSEAIGHLPHQWGRLYRKFLVGSLIHTVSLLRTARGELPRITLAEMWPTSPPRPADQPPSLLVWGELADHTRVELSWLWLPSHPSYQETLEVHGTEGSLELSLPQPYLRHPIADLIIRHRQKKTRHGGDAESAFVRELRAFHTAITTGGHPQDALGAAADLAWLQEMLATLTRRDGLTAGGESGAGASPDL